MIRKYDLDRLAQHRAAGIFDRHPCRDDRTWTAQIGIKAGLIVENADPHDIIGDLRAGARRRETHDGQGRNQRLLQSHDALPKFFVVLGSGPWGASVCPALNADKIAIERRPRARMRSSSRSVGVHPG
jgi:hypothetical protein